MTFEKIFSAKTLIALNLSIIVLVELTGTFFLETGLIHLIALAFLLLGISRIFVNYRAFDQFLTPLIWGSVVALILFAFSHLHEFIAFESLNEPYSHDLYIDVTNLYMTGMLLVACGAHFFIARRDRKWGLLTFLTLGALASLTLSILGFLRVISISIEPDEPDVYIYSVVVVAASLVSINRLLSIGNKISMIKTFSIYLSIGFFLLLASALHYSLYEVLEHAGLPDYQIIYIGHFLFFMALSVLFLAFPKLVQKSGIYTKLPNS